MPSVKQAWNESAVKKTLNDYAAGTRRLFLCMEIAGWSALIAAAMLDLFGSWPSWTFLPNVVNTFSGFLIGVPVALVLFTTLTNERENNRLERLSCGAWNDFADRVRAFCSTDRVQALEDAELSLGELWRTIRQEMLDAIGPDATKAIVTLPKDGAYSDFQGHLELWCQQMTTQFSSIEKRFPNAGTLELEWLAIRRSWTVLDVSVKTQRFAADNRGWLPETIDTSLQQKLERSGNPLSEFSDIHDKKGPDLEYPPMGSVPHWICKFSRRSRQEFAQQVAGATKLSPPYTLCAGTYISAAVHARMFLEELVTSIDNAENVDGWPGSCTQS